MNCWYKTIQHIVDVNLESRDIESLPIYKTNHEAVFGMWSHHFITFMIVVLSHYLKCNKNILDILTSTKINN